ncbi:MAG: PIN domain-containing protein [Burkholderiales bacterium]
MIVVDTSVWIDWLAGRSVPHVARMDELMLAQAPLALCDIILHEVLRGVRSDARFDRLRQELFVLPCLGTGGAEFAISAARRYRTLRVKGITIDKLTGLYIACACLDHDTQLLHNDRDFDPLEKQFGLRVMKMN